MEHKQPLLTAGGGPGNLNVVEVWDGTNWTEVGEINTGRVSASLSGSSTLSLYYGGYNGSYLTNTEAWNGSAWAEVADIATARGDATRAGSGNTSALMAGGWSPDPSSAAE
jgi:hypothetical protein